MLDFDNLSETINRNIQFYWKDFKSVAFALYDQEKVYLYNHPKFPYEGREYHILKWNEQFNGANTLIIYEEYPTAIINLNLYKEMVSIYSIVVHELFHGFQYLKGEERFPDEILSFTYPLVKENVELRNRERRCLHSAVASSDKKEKLNFIKDFICLREKRRRYINKFMDYETTIETVEGPAFYVELHAYSHISPNQNGSILQKYGEDLLDSKEAAFNLRKSCYSSGLYICLLLDELYPDWKESFFEADKLLYDFLKDIVEWETGETGSVKISEETKTIINTIRENKQETFRQFENMVGCHIFITGDIVFKGFDPMNIVAAENQLFHKNFISVLISGKEYHINQPVVTHYRKKYNNINKLHLVLDEEPVYNNGIICIGGLGEIEGQLIEDKGVYYFYC